METLLQDLRFAVRTLGKNPRFTVVAVATIALGIGANSAVFSLVNGVLLEPLPLRDPRRLVQPDVISPLGYEISLSIPNFRDWREQSRSFTAWGANVNRDRTLIGGDRPQVVTTRWVLGDWFEVLGVQPAIGRWISGEETWEGAAPVAVATHRFWQQHLDGAANPLGRSIVLDGQPFTVIGVMPESFTFPTATTDLFLPMGFFANGLCWEERDCSQGTWAVARLADGVTMEQAQADLDRVVAGLREREGEEVAKPRLQPLQTAFVGDIATQIWVLMAATGFVLLIAAANVAGLLLARGEGRRRELAVRTAIGAGQGRIARQLLTESLLLAAVGGVVGVAVGWAGLRLMLPLLAGDIPSMVLGRIGLDPAVLGFTSVITLGVGLLFGSLPALRARRTDPAHELKEGRTSSTSRSRNRLRTALVVAEVALSLVLLIGAGLMVRSLRGLRQVDKGFDESHVFGGLVALPGTRYGDKETAFRFFQELRDRVAGIPGVRNASISNIVPLTGNSWERGIFPEGADFRPENETSVLFHIVTPEHFEVLGIPILRGRALSIQDRDGAPLVCVIDESMAERFWPGEDPIGKRVTFESEPREGYLGGARIYRTVVGVARNVRHYELETPSRVQVYVPLQQSRMAWESAMALLTKSEIPPDRITQQIWSVLQGMDPEVPFTQATTLTEVVDRALAPTMAVSSILGVFGLSALLLSAIGLFGIMSLTVVQRLRDIGIRMALGARAGDMIRMVAWQGLAITVGGVALGLLGAYALTRLMTTLLFGVAPVDPLTYLVFSVFLVVVAMAAAYLPARRATRVDPVVVLREE